MLVPGGDEDHDHDGEHRDHVPEDLLREEEVDPLPIGLRRRRDAVLAEQRDVQGDEPRQQRRQHEHVHRIEAREREAAVLGAALHQLLRGLPYHRDGASDVGGDAGCPVALLIPRQEIAGEREAEHDREEPEPDPPGDLARLLVGAEQRDLEQMRREHDHHRLRAVVMEPAHQPTASLGELDVVDAGPRGLLARCVARHERHAGDRLHEEGAEQRAAEHVGPARAAGDGLVEQVREQLAVAGPLIDKIAGAREEAQVSTFSRKPMRKR